MLQTLTPLFSVLFRFSVFVYLRVIPLHRIARFALPALYSLYLATTVLTRKPKPKIVIIPKKVEVDDLVDTKTGEILEEKLTIEGIPVVVEQSNGYSKELSATSASGNVSLQSYL
jgi:hypothetical protein